MGTKALTQYHNAKTEEELQFWTCLLSGSETKVVKMLSQRPQLAFCLYYTGSDPLSRAATNGMLYAVKALIASGADVNYDSNDITHKSPLNACLVHGGLRKSSTQILEVLLKAGADAQATVGMEEGRKPIMWLLDHSQRDTLDKLAMLIKYGAQVDSIDDYGKTVLHFCHDADPTVVRALIKRGADPNTQDDRGDTPLHLAADMMGRVGVLRTLLANGADPRIKNHQDSTVEDFIDTESDSHGQAKLSAMAGWRRKQLRLVARQAKSSAGAEASKVPRARTFKSKM